MSGKHFYLSRVYSLPHLDVEVRGHLEESVLSVCLVYPRGPAQVFRLSCACVRAYEYLS